LPILMAGSLLGASLALPAAEPAPDKSAAAGQSAAKPAAAPADSARAAGPAVVNRVELDTTQITGNRELPRVLYVVPWKRADLGRVLVRLWWAAAGALALGGVVFGLQTGTGLLAPVGLALAAWIVLGVLVEIAERAGLPGAAPGVALARLGRLPRADWGKFLAHTGMGLTVLGIAAVSAWEAEDIRLARPGDVIPVGGYDFRFDRISEGQGPNYVYQRGHFTALRGGAEVAVLEPEKRMYPVQGQPTTEAAIDSGLTRDLYLVLGDKQKEGDAWAVRAYLKPFANWIWLGALVMGIGGLVSLTDRRYRVGAAARRGPAAPVPAE